MFSRLLTAEPPPRRHRAGLTAHPLRRRDCMRSSQWLESDAKVLLLIFGALILGVLLQVAGTYFA